METQYSLIAEESGRHIEKLCEYDIGETKFRYLRAYLRSLREVDEREAAPMTPRKKWSLAAYIVAVAAFIALMAYGVINHPIQKGLPFCGDVPDVDEHGCKICCQPPPPA